MHNESMRPFVLDEAHEGKHIKGDLSGPIEDTI